MDRARLHEGIRQMRFEQIFDRWERSELSPSGAAALLRPANARPNRANARRLAVSTGSAGAVAGGVAAAEAAGLGVTTTEKEPSVFTTILPVSPSSRRTEGLPESSVVMLKRLRWPAKSRLTE